MIIDAANCFYRAFFALPSLRASDGFPTNAVYGFSQMLAKILREESPDSLVVAMDPVGGSTHRRELYPAYKANRDAQPEDLSLQWPFMSKIAGALGLPVIEVPGFEADDVIATIVDQAPDDTEISIVSTDKDLMQLVSKKVVLLDMLKETKVGPDEVKKRYGVTPEKLLDVRSLVGDPSDNIPGVKGIGEKGAAKLINEWRDLETLLENSSKVTTKRAREALENHAEDARMSKKLATLRRDVPIRWDHIAVPVESVDESALQELFGQLELTKLLDGFLVQRKEISRQDEQVETEEITTSKQLKELVALLCSHERVVFAAIGTEQLGGLPFDPEGLAFSLGDRQAAYIALADSSSEIGINSSELFKELRPVFQGRHARPWLAHGTKRIQTLFFQHNLEINLPSFDTEIAAFLIDPAQQHSVPALASRYLKRTILPWDSLVGRGAKAKPIRELSEGEVSKWAGEYVCCLDGIADALDQQLEKDGLCELFRDIELPLTEVLSKMERSGVRINELFLKQLSDEFESELASIESRIYDLAGERFQIRSPKQLQVILFEKLGLPAVRKTKTGYSTDESVLEKLSLQHELPVCLLAYRKLSKLRSTYVEALPRLVNQKTGRLHPAFHQTGAATGRLSSSHPNAQNIPIRTQNGARIREAFIPADERLLFSVDYSQIELRILAHYSKDESLLEAFRTGQDIHLRTAAEVQGIDVLDVSNSDRTKAKAINFGIIYGQSAFGLAKQLNISSSEAQETIESYFDRYKGVRRFLDETKDRAREDGFVRTLFGRRRYLHDIGSRNRVLRAAAERMAVNTVIQGTAADLMKKAMVSVQAVLVEKGLSANMVLQVHDELVFELPSSELGLLETIVRECMESVHTLRVPLFVDCGSGMNWREAH